MDLPNFRRGFELNSTELNKLSDAIRSASVNSVIGGTFSRTPGGTTITVTPQVRGGDTGGGAGIPCPFKCFDASDANDLKVQVTWGLIWQMLPTGMFPTNDPPLKMIVTETCFLYSKITFNTNTLLPTAVSFSVETEIKKNTSTIQYNLIAIVTVNENVDPKVISKIENICQQPFPSPCALAPEASE
ncbi:hypothetical protein UFOVP781_48 [uncultured Caudovirales phage]|uniref:Uncharacterized protein n=1 Tax=uncultured Caudovirales phage TaxID=2100421 RepID=A0A6J5LLY1_9CAUD|nr:hypothetical protein UFOVP279_15 [uncultured Caudovirales phage]CAB4162465.1 hypothetical protein UFOVP781_48 [uncultured Caudovirales phage]